MRDAHRLHACTDGCSCYLPDGRHQALGLVSFNDAYPLESSRVRRRDASLIYDRIARTAAFASFGPLQLGGARSETLDCSTG
jgi:hypothetical protein